MSAPAAATRRPPTGGNEGEREPWISPTPRGAQRRIRRNPNVVSVECTRRCATTDPSLRGSPLCRKPFKLLSLWRIVDGRVSFPWLLGRHLTDLCPCGCASALGSACAATEIEYRPPRNRPKAAAAVAAGRPSFSVLVVGCGAMCRRRADGPNRKRSRPGS
jgi:hypothetical protein